MKKHDKNKVATEFIWNMIGVCINSFISLFYLIIVTRINGISNAGIFSYYYSISLVLYSFINYGGRNYQTSDFDKEFKDIQYFNIRYITSFITLLFLFVILIFSNNINKILILSMFVLARIIESFSDSLYAVFQKKNHLDYVGKSLILKNILSLLLFVIIDIYFKNMYLAVASILLSTVFVYLVYDKVKQRQLLKTKEKFNISISKSILWATKYYCLFNLIVMLLANIPRFFVEYNFTSVEQGYFGIIIMIPSVMVLLGQVILQPVIIKLTDYYGKREFTHFTSLSRKLFLCIFLITISCCTFVYYFGSTILQFLYNMNFADYNIIFVLIIIAGMFNVFANYFSTFLTIMRYTKKQFYIYIIILLISCILLYIGSKFNFKAMFIVYLLSMIVQAFVFFVYYKFEFNKEKKNG